MKKKICIAVCILLGLSLISIGVATYASAGSSFERETGFKDTFREKQGYSKDISNGNAQDNNLKTPPGPPIGGGAPISDGSACLVGVALVYGIYLLSITNYKLRITNCAKRGNRRQPIRNL
jgi:hypothetical protein